MMLGILNGVCFFFSDLMKRLDVPYEITFAKFSSYGKEQVQGDGSAVHILDEDKLKGRKVLLLDELEDNGKTMNTVRSHVINELGVPESDVTTCVIFSKSQPAGFKTKKGMRKADFIGVYIPDVWLVGYGLDAGGTRRGWVHLFGTPKSEGVPCSEDDKMFSSDNADEVYEAARRRIAEQLLSQRIDAQQADGAAATLRLGATAGSLGRKRARDDGALAP